MASGPTTLYNVVMSDQHAEEHDMQGGETENQTHKAVRKIILQRLGLTHDDILPVSFPKFLQIYEDFETAAVFYDEYYTFQRHIYAAYQRELNRINDKGISHGELKMCPQLFMYKNQKDRRLPANYALFFAYLKDEFRRFNTPAVSLTQQETQLVNYYAEYELMASKYAQVQAEQEVEQRHINNILDHESDGEAKAAQILRALQEGEERVKQITEHQRQEKVARARHKIDRVVSKQLEVQLEIDNIMEERIAAENVDERAQLSTKVRSLFGNFKRQIKYANAFSNKYYNEDKEERRRQAEQRRKDRLDQKLQEQATYKTYMLRHAELEQRDAETRAKVSAAAERSRQSAAERLRTQSRRSAAARERRELEDKAYADAQLVQALRDAQNERLRREKATTDRRLGGQALAAREAQRARQEAMRTSMLQMSCSAAPKKALSERLSRKSGEVDRERARAESVRRDNQRIKHLQQQMQAMRPGSAGYNTLVGEYMRLSTKVDY